MEALALCPNGIGRVLSWTVRYKRKPNVPLRYWIGEMESGPDAGKVCGELVKGMWKQLTGSSGDRIGERVQLECDRQSTNRERMEKAKGFSAVVQWNEGGEGRSCKL